MRILLAHPGAAYSTHDVWVGFGDAFTAAGHDVTPYRLDNAIDDMGTFHHWKWRRSGRKGPRPDSARIFYDAGIRMLEAALRRNVEWVVVVSAMYTHPDVLVMMRRAGLKVALLLTESPYDDDAQIRVAPFADVCFTGERASVPVLRQANPATAYLPHAAAPWHFAAWEDHDVPAHDVVFVGTMFQERIEALSAVNWDGIDLGLYGGFELVGSRSKLRRHIRGGVVSNLKTAALYRRAKVGLNLYRTSIGFGKKAPRITGAESLNPRAYELAACGTFQVSDARAEVGEVFGTNVPTFETPTELEALIRHYLPMEQKRWAMADLARRAVEPHTYAARAAQVVDTLARLRRAA